jgi:phospholipase C
MSRVVPTEAHGADSGHHSADPEPKSRRRFLASAAAIGAGFALGCVDRAADIMSPTTRSGANRVVTAGPGGFDHVIVVMMENRSFDHMLGWVPRADGKQAGLWFTDRDGVGHRTWTLAPDFQGCGFNDPDHSFEGGRVQFNSGACDGFLRSGDNDIYSIGYYRRPDLDFFGRAIGDWTTADRYFCSILGPTFPNRFYQHSAQTDRISNTLVLSQLPTIWDRIAAAGLTGRYYFSDLAFIALWGNKYLSIARPFAQFLADAAAGTLPHLSFIDPKFGGESDGTSNDDHPFGDIRAGQHFMHQIYTAVTNSPAWERTVLVFNYDEWGGFFDHVPPPIGAVSAIDVAAGNTDGRLGFRTPLLVVSPYARANHVAHEVYDHTSILRMVEARWGLVPLGARDAATNNLADVLDFSRPAREAPQYPAPPDVVSAACSSPVTDPDPFRVGRSPDATSSLLVGGEAVRRTATLERAKQERWDDLRELASKQGWAF